MRIVGLDLGTTAVKIVEVESSFGRFLIQDHREIEVPEGRDPLSVASEALQGLGQKPHRLVVAMRSSKLTTRNLQLPTRDRKAIQSAVTFELEDELPFAIEDAVMDSSILAQTGQQSQVHVATTLKKVFVPELVRMQEAGIDPDIITTDSWALRTLLNRVMSAATQEKPLLVVQIGAETTLFHLQWRGFPMLGREINWGGRDITRALAARLGVNESQAETIKCNPSMLQDSHPEGLLPLVSEALESLRKELRHMDLVCKGICHEPLQSVVLCGGGSMIQGLPAWLEASTKLPVERLNSLSALSPSGVSYAEAADARMALAAGLAMSQVGQDRSLAINFRKGEFLKSEKGRELNLQTFRAPLIGAGVTAVAFFASMAVQSAMYGKQLEDRDAQLKKAMSGFFGSVSQSALRTYLASPSSLKNSLQKELEKNRELARVFGPNPASPLAYLKRLSDGIGRDLVIDVTRFQVGSAPDKGFDPTQDSTLSLTLVTPDPKAAEKLSRVLIPRLLQTSPEASAPTAEEIPASGGKPRRYKLTFTGKTAQAPAESEGN